MSLSRKVTAQIIRSGTGTADTITAYVDGHVSFHHTTRWQGEREYRAVTSPNYVATDMDCNDLEQELERIYDDVSDLDMQWANAVFRTTLKGPVNR